MGRLSILSALFFLTGCAPLADWPAFVSAKPQAESPKHYDFAWRLSGDREVAPLQVFDDGRRMWLQFPANAPVPAIFARGELGDTPLLYERNGPYLVIAGVWPVLVLRGGHLQSVVERIADKPPPQSSPRQSGGMQKKEMTIVAGSAATSTKPGNTATSDESGGPSSSLDKDRAGSPPTASPSDQVTRHIKEASSFGPTPSFDSALAPEPASVSAPAPTLESAPLARPVYAVSPADKNIRLALKRWANTAGWTFGPAHWTVDVDIPIVGPARFDDGFKQAVRALMASTELAARPLQACFYSNKVLRVISYAQSCDRTANRLQTS